MDEVVVLSIPQIIVTFVAAMGIPSAMKNAWRSVTSRGKKREQRKKRTWTRTRSYSWRQSMHLSPSEKPRQGLFSAFRMRNATVICTQPWSMLRK